MDLPPEATDEQVAYIKALVPRVAWGTLDRHIERPERAIALPSVDVFLFDLDSVDPIRVER